MSRPRSQSARRSRPRTPGRRPGAVIGEVRPIVEQLADEQRLVVWDVVFAREAGQEILRVAVDREGGIDSEEIQRFSESLSRTLDETDAVPGEARYILEVSSPGAERRLRSSDEFRVCRGRPARLTFKDGRPPVEGVIGEVTEDSVELTQTDGGPLQVTFGEISQARLNVPGV